MLAWNSWLRVMKKACQLFAILFSGIVAPSPASAFFFTSGPKVIATPVNLSDKITIIYSFTFNHGNPSTKSNSWTYVMPSSFGDLHDGTSLPDDPDPKELYEQLGWGSGTPLIVNGAFLVDTINEDAHGSSASFGIEVGQNKIRTDQGLAPNYQAQFAVKYYDPLLFPSCVQEKSTCGAIRADLEVDLLVNGAPFPAGFEDGISITTRATEVPGPLAIGGLLVIPGSLRKLKMLSDRRKGLKG
jgi:hypothetical protein